ncbi:hypothetical protein T12_5513 [Trichinella patagoniensis]|uniref:Uncharacterized protein n=1 Tax=Trichinella patagoniensis TaxID=990121 RepID=A0A0V0ZIE9_9BILA|nr:hypothetical protein T12_5513 [Trichinella patagoniensis]
MFRGLLSTMKTTSQTTFTQIAKSQTNNKQLYSPTRHYSILPYLYENKVIKQCNGPSVTAGRSATALLFTAGSSPSELTFRHPTLLEEDINRFKPSQKMITRSITHQNRTPITGICLPRDTVFCYRLSGTNVPATVAESYIVVVHDLLGLS